jgi:hypothetical protein
MSSGLQPVACSLVVLVRSIAHARLAHPDVAFVPSREVWEGGWGGPSLLMLVRGAVCLRLLAST